MSMPLANISMKAEGMSDQSFNFSHYQDHVEIVQAINNKFGTQLPFYAIHPAADFDSGWRRLHQAFHNDMNAVLNVGSKDFTGEINDDWYKRNYLEHQAARSMLGI
jgi:hypothetical protein